MNDHLIRIKQTDPCNNIVIGDAFCVRLSEVLTPKLSQKIGVPASVICERAQLEPVPSDRIRVYKNGVCALLFFLTIADRLTGTRRAYPMTVIWKNKEAKPIMPREAACVETDVGLLIDREVKEALRRCFARFSLSARMDPTPFSLMIRPVGAYAEIRLEIKPPLVARQISQLREHILRFLRGRENATLTFLAWPSETSSREMSLPVRIGRDGEDVLCDFLASLSSLPYPTERVSVLPLSVDRLARLTVYG